MVVGLSCKTYAMKNAGCSDDTVDEASRAMSSLCTLSLSLVSWEYSSGDSKGAFCSVFSFNSSCWPMLYLLATLSNFAFRWARNITSKISSHKKRNVVFQLFDEEATEKKGERWMPAAVYIWNGKAKGKGCNTDIITLPEPHTNIREGKQGELDTREGGGSRWLLKSFVPLPCVAALLAYIFLGLRIEFTWCCSWADRYEGLADEMLNVLSYPFSALYIRMQSGDG